MENTPQNINQNYTSQMENPKQEEVKVVSKNPSKILIISLVSVVLILAVLIALFLTGVVDPIGNEKGICEYMGEIYEDGEKFPAEDGCNTCTCEGSTGSVYCTEIYCIPEGEEEENGDEQSSNEDDDTPVQASELQLPSDIYEEQVYKEYSLNDISFLVYIRSNMNYPLTNSNGESGVLYAESGDIEWRAFLKVNELGASKNNIFYFGYDLGLNGYVLLLIDANGAGSGEGIAKVVGLNQANDSWDVLECFYFIPEHWELDDISNLREEVDTYLEQYSQHVQPSGATNCSNFKIVEG